MEDGSVAMNSTGYIKVNSDMWDDLNKIYKVIEWSRTDPGSTAVKLILETPDKQIIKRTLPIHWIEWIEDKDW